MPDTTPTPAQREEAAAVDSDADWEDIPAPRRERSSRLVVVPRDRLAELEAENALLRQNNQRLHEELDAERRSFPDDGVFLSRTTPGGWSCTKIGELDDPDPAGLARVARHTDLIARAILRAREQAEGYVPSAYTEAQAIVQALREALAEGSGE